MSDQVRGNTAVLKNSVMIWVGALLMLIGSGMYWVFADAETRLACDRNTGECLFEKKSAFASNSERFPIDAIQGGRLESGRSRDSEGRQTVNYWASLDTEQGPMELSAFRSSSRKEHRSMLEEVDAFLENPDQNRLHIGHKAQGWVMWLLMAFPIAGAFMVFGARSVIEVEAGSGMLKLTRRRWWHHGGKEERLSLDSIDAVDVKTRRSSSTSRGRTHQAVIRMHSGEEKPIFGFASGKGAFNQAETIRKVLESTR